MSITDELREWAHGFNGPWRRNEEMLLAIADRIDAEHDADVSTACRLAAGLDDDALAKRGYIALPVDADGVPIRIGDVLYGYGKTIEVVELRYGRSGWVLISRDCNGYADTFAFTHYHAPTVEDVLTKMLEQAVGYSDAHTTVAANAIVEYAAKLRLAEEVDA